MMRKVLGSLLAAVLLTAGCAGVKEAPSAPAAPQDGAPMGIYTSESVSLKVTATRATYSPAQPVEVTVLVRNEGKEPVPFIRFNGCDPGVRVRAKSGDGTEHYVREKLEGPPRACTEAIQNAQLAPGAEIEVDFTWDQTTENVPAAPGEYTVTATFNRGGDYEQLQPVEASLKVRLEGGTAFITKEKAVAAAKAHPQFQDWWGAHTGPAIVKQEAGQWYILNARSYDDPTGEWVKSAPELAAQVRASEPEVTAQFQEGIWEVRAFTKLGPAPREAQVRIDAKTAQILAFESK